MTVASPCINVCQMDPVSGLCRGCLRNIDEIALWSRASDADKVRILALVAKRRAGQPGPVPGSQP